MVKDQVNGNYHGINNIIMLNQMNHSVFIKTKIYSPLISREKGHMKLHSIGKVFTDLLNGPFSSCYWYHSYV